MSIARRYTAALIGAHKYAYFMRVLTWNINGLRAILKRKCGTLQGLLDDLKADIICFQETKLTKSDFDRDLALVEGW